MKQLSIVPIFLVLCSFWNNSFAQLWESGGGGCNREVRALYADTVENALLVGGSFRYAGGVEVNQIAKWDGQMWDDIGGGSGDTSAPGGPAILGIVRFEGDLFAGGFMQMMGGNAACRSLARWDGQSWNACGSPDAQVNLEVTNGKLFAMGFFNEIDGKPIPRLASWDGSEWQLFGDSLPFNALTGGYLWCSEFYQGEYYFGGNFDLSDSLMEIMRWDGTQWKALSQGVPGNAWINDITVFKEQLFVGGQFHSSEGNAASFLMAWDGMQWYNPLPDVQFMSQVWELELIDGELFIIGGHRVWDGFAWSNEHRIARYDGESFCSFGGEHIWALSIAEFHEELYVNAGWCMQLSGHDSLFPNGRDTVRYIAKWMGGDSVDICISQPVGLEDQAVEESLMALFPNPARSGFSFVLPDGIMQCRYRVFNLEGLEVVAEREYAAGEHVDMGQFRAGLYIVEVKIKDKVQRLKLMRQ